MNPKSSQSQILLRQAPREGWFDEGCFITEWLNDDAEPEVSVARARVLPNTTTAWHRLDGVTERYVIISGTGMVEVQGLAKSSVGPGDIVHIAPGDPQRIHNPGPTDLVFLAICSPRFELGCYSRVTGD